MMSNRFVAAAEAAALETVAVLSRRALGNINPNFDEIDSEFDDSKVVESKKKRKTTRNIAASTTVATTTTTTTTTTTAT